MGAGILRPYNGRTTDHNRSQRITKDCDGLRRISRTDRLCWEARLVVFGNVRVKSVDFGRPGI